MLINQYDKLILVLHDGLRRNLYLSIAEAAKDNNMNVVIFCFSIEEYYWFKINFDQKNCISLIRNHKPNKLDSGKVERSIDVVADFISINQAAKIYSSMLNALNNEVLAQEKTIIFGGNGLHSFDIAIKNFSLAHPNIHTIFSELSNIDNKTFFDCLGSNASSFFYKALKNNSISFPNYNNEKFKKWKEDYCKHKLSTHIIKQAPQRNLVKKIIHRICGLIEIVLNIPSYQKYKFTYNLKKKKKKKTIYIESWNGHIDEIEKKENYIFFPLQVFEDSQIKLHSNIDNLSAIKHLNKLAEELKLTLVIKPHPAETNRYALDSILELKKIYKFKISNKNTFELIKHSQKTVVINSTVGLESILLNKETIFLGESFYKYFSDEKILNYYLNHWLIDIDIFSHQKISNDKLNAILEKANNIHD
ncbi:hypothetical protein OSC03_10825 [Morganella morganii]|uniref:capsular polysaccharide export protein, LipB/KpsS family n=1 Tax=Morganella morganii TaxID=582 RepID=UPI00287501CD|nr:hypothetical protein [Morganella morganii]MDS0907514.1 hypothetical protein [Morganella morganii]